MNAAPPQTGDAANRGEYSRIPDTDTGNIQQAMQFQEAPERDVRSLNSPPWSCRLLVDQYFINNNYFQSLMACVILANAILIGFETDMPERSALWEKIEDSLLAIFTFELGMRAFVMRSELFTKDFRSNMFDLFIVGTGVMDYAVCSFFPGARKSKLSSFIKIFRLLRIMRLFRLLKMFKQLYLLANGFVESTSAVFWVSVLCGLFLYVCAIFLTRTIGRGAFDDVINSDMQKLMQDQYGSVPRSMFSLFQLMADPNIDHLRGIMLRSPAAMFFFTCFIIFGSFAMLSILTGVISESMIEKGNNHKEEMRFEEERKKRAFIETISQLFLEADTDHDGTLTREEFRANLHKLVKMFTDQGLDYKEEDMEMVFDLVDFDGGGTIELAEFLDGMGSFTANVGDLPLQMLQLKSKLCKYMKDNAAKHAAYLDSKFDEVLTRIDGLEARIQTLAGGRK